MQTLGSLYVSEATFYPLTGICSIIFVCEFIVSFKSLSHLHPLSPKKNYNENETKKKFLICAFCE